MVRLDYYLKIYQILANSRKKIIADKRFGQSENWHIWSFSYLVMFWTDFYQIFSIGRCIGGDDWYVILFAIAQGNCNGAYSNQLIWGRFDDVAIHHFRSLHWRLTTDWTIGKPFSKDMANWQWFSYIVSTIQILRAFDSRPVTWKGDYDVRMCKKCGANSWKRQCDTNEGKGVS